MWDKVKPAVPGGSFWYLAVLDVALAAAVLAAGIFLLTSALKADPRVLVTVEVDGTTLHCRALPESTVAELLSSVGIRLREGDALSASKTDAVREGMNVVVTRSFPVAVRSQSSVSLLYMTAGTVGDALREAGVVCDVNDELTNCTFADVAAGMQIVHVDVQTSYTTSYKTLNYKEVAQYDESVYNDTDPVLIQSGADGTKQVTQRIVMKDGKEVSREVVDQVVITPATDEIYKYGTKIHYQTNYTGEWRIYKPKPTAGENGWVEMRMDYITAYYTGTRTACGTRPDIGTIAVNPYYIPYYTQIWVKGYGYGKALDTGAFRNYKNPDGSLVNQLDLFFNSKSEATRWGRKRNVVVLVKLG